MPMQGSGFGGIFTNDYELMVSETEREKDVFSQYLGSFSSTKYVILASLDNPLFPHNIQGQVGDRLDITSLYFAGDLQNATEFILNIGVITRIDGTNADIKFIINLPFLTGGSRVTIVDSLRGVPSQVKLDFTDGVLQHGISNISETNVAAVNTGITLDSPAGSITPGLGDVIIKYTHTSGSSVLGMFIFYHKDG